MGALKIIVQTLCAGLTAAAVYGAETNVLTKAEQKKLNRIGMKAATRLERTSGKLIEAPPVKAKASRLTRADIPIVTEAISKAGILASDVPAVLAAIAKAGILADDAPLVLEAIANARRTTSDAVTVVRLSGTAEAATAVNMPVFQRINHVVTATAYNYVFVWRDDKDLVFPDLATRRASSDTYFGGLEKQIAEACKTNDTERAGVLMRDYVDKWDNVYKVKRQMPGSNRRSN
jgi:hypothetical protein